MIDFAQAHQGKESEYMRKATGIVRRLDDLGRVVIPKELRDAYDIASKDPIEFYTFNDEIVLRKYQNGCSFCGNTENLQSFRGKHVCGWCKDELLQVSR